MTQFGYRTGTWRGWTAEGAAAELARLGYDSVELCLETTDVRPETMNEARAGAIRRALSESGIGLASVSYHGDNEPYDQRRANQERAVRLAPWLGATIVVLNAEKATDLPRQWAEHVAHYGRLAQVAEQSGVTIAIEPEPLLVVGSSADMARLMQEVGSPRLRVNLDIGHAQVTDDDLVATIRQLGSAIVHLHLEDIKGRVHRHLPFGEGDIDFAAVRRALEEIGYAGPYVVDLFGQSAEPPVVAERALAALRQYFA